MSISDNITKLFVTFFYFGKSPIMPGTFGSLGAFLFLPLLYSDSLSIIFIIFLFFLGAYFSDLYVKIIDSDNHDLSEIVIDEVLGQFLALYIASCFGNLRDKINEFSLDGDKTLFIYILSLFILFRFFDIVKPFPICYVDKRMENSIGVMMDDVLAGIFAGVLYLFVSSLLS